MREISLNNNIRGYRFEKMISLKIKFILLLVHYTIGTGITAPAVAGTL